MPKLTPAETAAAAPMAPAEMGPSRRSEPALRAERGLRRPSAGLPVRWRDVRTGAAVPRLATPTSAGDAKEAGVRDEDLIRSRRFQRHMKELRSAKRTATGVPRVRKAEGSVLESHKRPVSSHTAVLRKECDEAAARRGAAAAADAAKFRHRHGRIILAADEAPNLRGDEREFRARVPLRRPVTTTMPRLGPVECDEERALREARERQRKRRAELRANGWAADGTRLW